MTAGVLKELLSRVPEDTPIFLAAIFQPPDSNPKDMTFGSLQEVTIHPQSLWTLYDVPLNLIPFPDTMEENGLRPLILITEVKH